MEQNHICNCSRCEGRPCEVLCVGDQAPYQAGWARGGKTACFGWPARDGIGTTGGTNRLLYGSIISGGAATLGHRPGRKECARAPAKGGSFQARRRANTSEGTLGAGKIYGKVAGQGWERADRPRSTQTSRWPGGNLPGVYEPTRGLRFGGGTGFQLFLTAVIRSDSKTLNSGTKHKKTAARLR